MTIMAGIDMHVKTLVCEIGYEKNKPKKMKFSNSLNGYANLLRYLENLKTAEKATDVLVAYEASGFGYLLHDILVSNNYRCEILAPTELERSANSSKKKTDKKDASYIYENIRGHVLAGNRLHNIWIPDKELRDDRDVNRVKYDLGTKIAEAKSQIHTLLKKNGIRKPDELENWSKPFYQWLLLKKKNGSNSFQICLEFYLQQLDFLEYQKSEMEKKLLEIAMKPRFRKQYQALIKMKGVGLNMAMTFLTEIGDVNRFSNRKELGAYMGLVPSSHESGEITDRKGRITRDGPYRLRSVLNQAVWVHLRYCGEEKAVYDRIVARNPKRKKKAVVACMRRLGIRMWHVAKDAIANDEVENRA